MKFDDCVEKVKYLTFFGTEKYDCGDKYVFKNERYFGFDNPQ